jgi:polyisoprenyl-phosphate glycosyltransferase
MSSMSEHRVHAISVIVPVYRGEQTLDALVRRLIALSEAQPTREGHAFRVAEVLLVFDNGPDHSDVVIRQLARECDIVLPVWLMRNSGQHAATAAGIASSGSEWVVTLDEDGQHDPGEIARLVDTAIASGSYLVYGINEKTPHRRWRNATSWLAKAIARGVGGSELGDFSSFRLIEGHRARAACAFIGPRMHLDVALTWTIDRTARCTVIAQAEGREGSGYGFFSLLSHFWTLVLSSGTRPLRIVSIVGLVSALGGFVAAGVVAWQKVRNGYDVEGWASVFIAIIVMGGLILFALGVVAEYVGSLLRTVQGRPLFVIGDDPEQGPLRHDDR